MGIQKTSNGKYRVQVQVRGRGRKGCTVETYDDAVLAEDKLKKALIDEDDLTLAATLISKAVDGFSKLTVFVT